MPSSSESKVEVLNNALLDQVVNIKTRLELPGLQGGTEPQADCRELLDVLLGEIDPLTIQVVQVGIEDIPGEGIIDAQIPEMGELKLAGDQYVGARLLHGGGHRLVLLRILVDGTRD